MNTARKIIHQYNEDTLEQPESEVGELNNITPPKGVFVPLVINNITEKVDGLLKGETEGDLEIDEKEVDEIIENYKTNKGLLLGEIYDNLDWGNKIEQLITEVLGIKETLTNHEKIQNLFQDIYCDIINYLKPEIDQDKIEVIVEKIIYKIKNDRNRFFSIAKINKNIPSESTYDILFDLFLSITRTGSDYNYEEEVNGAERFFFETIEVQKLSRVSDMLYTIDILNFFIGYFCWRSWETFSKKRYNLMKKLRNKIINIFGQKGFILPEFLKNSKKRWGIEKKFCLKSTIDKLPGDFLEIANTSSNFDDAIYDYVESLKGPCGRFEYFLSELNEEKLATWLSTNIRTIRISNDRAIFMENDTPSSFVELKNGFTNIKFSTYHNINGLYSNNYHNIFSELHNITNSINDTGEDYTFLMQLLHRPNIMSQIEHSLGISFKDYPFSIQPYFLKFLAYAKKRDFKKIKFFLGHTQGIPNKYARMKTFLATSEDRKFGDKIIEIDKTLIKLYGLEKGTRLGDELFGKYSEITEILEKEADEIQKEYFGEHSTLKFSRYDYIKNLISRVNQLLEDINIFLGKKPSLEELESKIDEYNKELIQYGTLFQVSSKHNLKSINEVTTELGIQKTTKKGNELTEKEKEDIINLYEFNYKNNPDKDIILKYIKEGLEKDFNSENVDFYIFSQRNNCLLTIKFIHVPDGTIYAGAFNANNQFQFYNFGKFILDKLLNLYKDKTIKGHVLKTNSHLLDYYKKFSFEVEKDNKGEPIVEMNNGVEFYRIIRRPEG